MDKIFSNVYNEQSCGRSGRGSIDLFSGNLTFVHDLVKYGGFNLPIELSLVYSTYSTIYSATYPMPGSWRFNFMQSLRTNDSDNINTGDPNHESYIYEDASGRTQIIETRYYKNLTMGSGDSAQTYKRYGYTHDTSGVLSEISNDQYILTKSGSNKILSDNAGNKLYFNANGLLTRMEKAEAVSNGPKMTFEYLTNQICLTDASGRKAYVNFNNGKLTTLSANDIVINFEIGDFNRLDRISYSFSSEPNKEIHYTEFLYYSLGKDIHKLISVRDISGLQVTYTYPEVKDMCAYSPVVGYKISTISSEIKYDNDMAKGVVTGKSSDLENVSIGYNVNGYGNLTKVTDAVGTEKYYFFKSDGSLHVSYDDRGNSRVHALNTNFHSTERDGGGIDYTSQSEMAQILGTSPNLINPSFATSIAATPGGSREYGYNFSGTSLNNLEEGWYVFSVEAKGELTPSSYFSSRLQAGDIPYLAIWFWGTYNETVIAAERFAKFDDKNTGWQIAALPFYLNKRNLQSFKLWITSNRNENSIQLRNWSLRRAYGYTDNVVHGSTSIFMSDGEVTTTIDTAKRNNGTRVTRIAPKGFDAIENVTYYHNIYKERAIREESGLGYKKTYDYDDYGNITVETTEEISTGQKMRRQYNYDFQSAYLNKNAIRSITDESGKTIVADYDATTGLLIKTILPGTNQNIEYAYKGIDKLLGEIKAIGNSSTHVTESSNKLYYNAGYLTRMEHNGFNYDFVYDGFGRIKNVRVGGVEVISVSYTDIGDDLDGIAGAVSKVVTSYAKVAPCAGVFCGEEFCGDCESVLGYASPSLGILCGQLSCGQAVCGHGSEDNDYNNTVASYYNKYGDLIKVRYKVNSKIDYQFSSADDYITVTYTENNVKRMATYEIGDVKYEYNYDQINGEMFSRVMYRDSTPEIKLEINGRDKQRRITGIKYTIDSNNELCYNYTYKSVYDDVVKTITLPNSKEITIETDIFGRIVSRAINAATLFSDSYSYKTNGDYTTSLVYEISQKVGSNDTGGYRYIYDENNNITEVYNKSTGQLISSYEYDGLRRLKYENNVDREIKLYYYNAGGNLTHKKIFNWQQYNSYSYEQLLNLDGGEIVYYDYEEIGNKDRLVSYRGSGILEYDVYGNPRCWFKHASTGSALKYALKWNHGHELARIVDSDNNNSCFYEYNEEGIRIRKIANGVESKYYHDGNRIVAEKRGDNMILYYYDSLGICGFSYNGADYYFKKNYQGDIIRIYNSGGTLCGEYTYDAWGKCAIITDINGIASLNSFRYRGYYYDAEVGLYYLKSRYYDPEVGRFISPDDTEYLDPEKLDGLNLYAYCLNNPVMYVDPDGNFVWFIVAAFAIGFVVNTASSAISQAMTNNGKVDWGVALVDGAFGGLSMAISVIPSIGPALGAFIDFGLSSLNSLVTAGMQNGWDITWGDVGNAVLNGVMSVGFSYATSKFNVSMKGTSTFKRASSLSSSVSKKIRNGTYYLNKSVSAGKQAVRAARKAAMRSIVPAFTTNEAYFAYGVSLVQSILSNLLS